MAYPTREMSGGSPNAQEREDVGEFVEKTTGLTDKKHPHQDAQDRTLGDHPHSDLVKKI